MSDPLILSTRTKALLVEADQAHHGDGTALCTEDGTIIAKIPGEAWRTGNKNHRTAVMLALAPAMVEALTVIAKGSAPTGRWLVEHGGCLECYDEEALPKTHYDARDKVPDPRNAGLTPAFWMPYTQEEQRTWLSAVASLATATLKPLLDLPPESGV